MLLTISAAQENGGQITSKEHHAHIVLVSEPNLRSQLDILRLRYDVHDNMKLRNIYVETLEYLSRCINTGVFILGGNKKIKMGMPGPRPKGKMHRA